MSISNKRLLILVGVLIVGLTIIVTGYRVTTGGTLILDVSSAESVENLGVYVGGQQVFTLNENDNTYTVTGLRGDKRIIVTQPGYEDFDESQTFFWKGEKTIVAKFAEIPPNQVVGELVYNNKVVDDSSADDFQYHGNRSWVTFRVPVANSNDEEVVIAKYNPEAVAWEIFNNEIETEFYVQSDVYEIPSSLLAEIRR